jgi:4-amino-4-deoxy-L-arabinose transferase-like glycosyltransferase
MPSSRDEQRSDPGRNPSGRLDPFVIALIALGLRLIHLDHTPQVDELNHVLAARSLLSDGTLSIAGGLPYPRAWLFTYLVAGLFRAFGESLVVARLPSVVAGTMLALAVFVWVRRAAGRGAAWTAGLLVALAPQALYQSQQARFYALQALAFWIGAALVYEAEARSVARRHRIGLAAAAGLALAFALHLQQITAAGIAALLAWLAARRAPALVAAIWRHPQRLWLAGGLAILLSGSVAWLVQSDAAARAWSLFRYADVWAEGGRGEVRYYHWLLLDQYPTLWTLLPVGCLLAWLVNGRAAVFCALMFVIPFTFHSLAAWKSERYLAYAMPMFFALWGMAIAGAAGSLGGRLGQAVAGWPALRARGRSRAAAAALLAGAGLFAAAVNSAFPTTFKMLTVSDGDWQSAALLRGEPDWGAGADSLRRTVPSTVALVASSDLKALYYFGRLDVILSATQLARHPEFTVSDKVRRPMVASAEAMRQVLASRPNGIVLIERAHWRSPAGVPEPTADYLEAHTCPVVVPVPWKLVVFRWRRDEGSTRGCGG